MIFKFCSLFFLILLSTASALEPKDRSDILQIIQDYTESWNLRGGVGFADGFAENADFVNIYGMQFKGKAEIEERHVKIIQNLFKGSIFETQETQLREVQPGLVIATIRWTLNGYRNPGSDLSQEGETRSGIFTQVFTQSNDKWEIAASQNTMIPKPNPSLK